MIQNDKIQIPFSLNDLPEDYPFVYTLNYIFESCMSSKMKDQNYSGIQKGFVDQGICRTLGAAIKHLQCIKKLGGGGQTRKMKRKEIEFFTDFFGLTEAQLINPAKAQLHYCESEQNSSLAAA